MQKYEFTSETIETADGHTLHRIRALRDFGNVKAGDLGGYIELEDNLSHDGDCWVGGNAYVYRDVARVYENAIVCGDAVVCGQVYGNAYMSGYTRAYIDAHVYGNARILKEAWVYSDGHVYGNSEVAGSARIASGAKVYGNAKIAAHAKIIGEVYENATIGGRVRIYGSVYGNAKIAGSGWVWGKAYGNAKITGKNEWSIPINCEVYEGDNIVEIATAA
ncbi:polymer-forming cytoskeletal protein [Bartonella sp. WD12.1]|uniref:polymer-forming cytoskeletal protein n=1 Tax=Bartonella sp. WD12.1 TaxID=1933903 RepID=UPI00099B0CF8|nr:polymer-forming cytoskeletal protein [Bartonella sp. WD12.1]OPB29470.1 hypothetical protein BWD121_004900 [Bartonella sp. WD12.1]